VFAAGAGSGVAGVLLVLALLLPATAAAEEPARKDVLLLYADSMLLPANAVADRELRTRLGADAATPVRFYTEALDLSWFPDKEMERAMLDLLRAKYANRNLALVIPVGPPALRFALLHRATIFPGVPLVFVAAREAVLADLPLPPDVTGMWMDRDWRANVELILRLHPDTRRIAFVSGGGTTPSTAVEFQRVAASYRDRVEPIELTDRTFEEMLKEAAALPEHTVILVGLFLRDRAGRTFTNAEVVEHIVRTASVPVYSALDVHVGRGIVGGYVVRWEQQAARAAALALRVLRGERLGPAAATSEGTNAYVFDERVLKRWQIDRRRLPPGSVVLFHEPSFWELYRGYVVAAVSLLLVQGGLIGVLLVQRAQRRRAQRNLAERLRFETLLSDLSTVLLSCPATEVDRQVETGLQRVVENLGADRAAIWALEDRSDEARLTHSWIREGVPPLPRAVRESEAQGLFSQLRQGHVVRIPQSADPPDEAAIDRESLARFGMRSTAVVPLIERGSVVGGLSVGTVVEERRWPDELIPRLRLLADVFANALARQRGERVAHESAEHIRELAGRLITSQEEERRRIARELHDGVNQELAALSIALTALQAGLPEGTAPDRRQEIAQLQRRSVEMAETIRLLSHELHPGILQYAGLTAALRSHCQEFEREHGVTATLQADDDLGTVPADVALCLYRVTQEALQNVARHAKASQVRVVVARDGTDLVLTIGDDGRGFDLAEGRGRGGLGLISLDERVRLAKGRLTIDTQPQRGTEIQVVVPLAEIRDAPGYRTAR
jgi:two-component system, NarL family, sensor kinase